MVYSVLLIWISALHLIRVADAGVVPTVTEDEYVTVWTGQPIDLSCDRDDVNNTVPEEYHIIWRKGYDILTAANFIITHDSRIIINNLTNIQINNASTEDAGEYTCFVNSRPTFSRTYSVNIEVVTCTRPDPPAHGSVTIISQQNGDNYTYGDQAQYYCNPGYALIGPNSRYCNDPDSEWSDVIPSCEPQTYANLRNQFKELTFNVTNIRGNLHELPVVLDKLSALENRVSKLEVHEPGSKGLTVRSSGSLQAEVARLTKALNINNRQKSWHNLLHTEVGQLGVKDNSLVSEYTWFVKDIDDKIQEYKTTGTKYIESKPFYTHIPGYHLKMHLYPNYYDDNCLGLYVVFVNGDYDEVIHWPFPGQYTLSVISRNANSDEASMTIVPSKVTACNFNKPPPDNKVGCGFGQFMTYEVLNNKSNLFKFEGGILLKITVYLV